MTLSRRQSLQAMLAFAPWGAIAQSAPRRIGLLSFTDEAQRILNWMTEELQHQGAVVGRDVLLQARWASGVLADLPRLAQELQAWGAQVVVAPGPAAGEAALKTLAHMPVVYIGSVQRLEQTAGFAQPTGRLTGVSLMLDQLVAKRLELLAELLPRGSVVLNIAPPNYRGHPATEAMLVDARRLGLVPHMAFVHTDVEIANAFALAKRLKAAAVHSMPGPYLHARRTHVIALAKAERMPVMYEWPESVHQGGLIGYGPDNETVFRQATRLAWQVANGTSPKDLPVENPMRITLAINLATARALGLSVPRTLLVRANEVVE